VLHLDVVKAAPGLPLPATETPAQSTETPAPGDAPIDGFVMPRGFVMPLPFVSRSCNILHRDPTRPHAFYYEVRTYTSPEAFTSRRLADGELLFGEAEENEKGRAQKEAEAQEESNYCAVLGQRWVNAFAEVAEVNAVAEVTEPEVTAVAEVTESEVTEPEVTAVAEVTEPEVTAEVDTPRQNQIPHQLPLPPSSQRGTQHSS
jgi:hypothetical protein